MVPFFFYGGRAVIDYCSAAAVYYIYYDIYKNLHLTVENFISELINACWIFVQLYGNWILASLCFIYFSFLLNKHRNDKVRAAIKRDGAVWCMYVIIHDFHGYNIMQRDLQHKYNIFLIFGSLC
ncbi:hypothetical protein ACJX0J_027016, partial [Zea mays]